MTGNEFWISSEGVILTFMISFVFSRKLKVSVTPRKSSAPVTSARRCCSILPLLWFKKYLTFPLQRCHIQQLLHIQPTKCTNICAASKSYDFTVYFFVWVTYAWKYTEVSIHTLEVCSAINISR